MGSCAAKDKVEASVDKTITVAVAASTTTSTADFTASSHSKSLTSVRDLRIHVTSPSDTTISLSLRDKKLCLTASSSSWEESSYSVDNSDHITIISYPCPRQDKQMRVTRFRKSTGEPVMISSSTMAHESTHRPVAEFTNVATPPVVHTTAIMYELRYSKERLLLFAGKDIPMYEIADMSTGVVYVRIMQMRRPMNKIQVIVCSTSSPSPSPSPSPSSSLPANKAGATVAVDEGDKLILSVIDQDKSELNDDLMETILNFWNQTTGSFWTWLSGDNMNLPVKWITEE